MNKVEYQRARRSIRTNGSYSLRWMPPPVAAEMARLISISHTKDPIQERVKISGYCQRVGIACPILHTVDLHTATTTTRKLP